MSVHYAPENYQMAENALNDKVILVTGAGSGIGKSAALHYAKYGASVVLVGRTQEKLKSAYDDIAREGYKTPFIACLDFTALTEQDCTQLVDQLHTEYGRLDGLLHNASILGERSPIEHSTCTVFEQVMRVNVNAAFMLTQYLLPLLKASENASVIFTSSSVGRKGRAYWGSYSISKFATEGLMQILADELESTSTVRVNSLNPGATRTPMRANAYPAEDPNTVKAPDDIMACYLYLMDEASTGKNGLAFNAQP